MRDLGRARSCGGGIVPQLLAGAPLEAGRPVALTRLSSASYLAYQFVQRSVTIERVDRPAGKIAENKRVGREPQVSINRRQDL